MDFDDLDDAEVEEPAAEGTEDGGTKADQGDTAWLRFVNPDEAENEGSGTGLRSATHDVPQVEHVKVLCRNPRNTPSGGIKAVVDSIETTLTAGINRPTRDPTTLNMLKEKLLDLSFIARNPEMRKDIIHLFGRLVELAVKRDAKNICDEISWQLCSMSFSLSGQDIDMYPAGSAGAPVVLLAGYGGSHIDDIRPAAQRWASHYGAAVLALSPCAEWMADQQLATFDTVMSLMSEGRPLVIHTFSNGGMNPAKNFLMRWSTALKQGKPNTPPITALRFCILDSFGLAGPSDTAVSGPICTFADVGWGPGTFEKGVTQLYVSLGLAMMIHYGAIESTATALGLAWGRAARDCVERGRATAGMKRFAWIPFSSDILLQFWERVPFLFIASNCDHIVNWSGSFSTADHIRKIPDRKEKLQAANEGASADLLGEDGLGVHTLFVQDNKYVPVAHAKHFKNYPKLYWGAVDKLALASLPSS